VSLVKYFLSILIIINLSMVALSPAYLQDSYAQQGPFVQDLACIGCVDIPLEEIELYKDLFPIIIWTDAKNYDHNSVITVNGFLRPENTFNRSRVLSALLNVRKRLVSLLISARGKRSV